MLRPCLKQTLRHYDERAYRVLGEDREKIVAANASMEHGVEDNLDLRVPSLAKRTMLLKLRAAGVAVPAHGPVVDLCCGTGSVARGLVGAELSSRIIGIDLSRPQLRHFRRAVDADPKLRRSVEILEADVAHLPLAAESAAMVVGNSFLHHLTDVDLVLREVARVLRPGGRFVVLHEPGTSATFFEGFPLSLVKDVSVMNYTDLWQFDPAELGDLLRTAGFEDVQVLTTGIVANVSLGLFSIVLRKVAPRQDWIHSALHWMRAYLYAAEYRLRLGTGPSLLVTGLKPS